MADRPDEDAGAPDGAGDLGEMGYGDALAEIDEILAAIDDPDLDVDLLGTQVRRATALIEHCRRRIATARLEVATAAEPAPPDTTETTGTTDAG